jgi:hypothetical protein
VQACNAFVHVFGVTKQTENSQTHSTASIFPSGKMALVTNNQGFLSFFAA